MTLFQLYASVSHRIYAFGHVIVFSVDAQQTTRKLKHTLYLYKHTALLVL